MKHNSGLQTVPTAWCWAGSSAVTWQLLKAPDSQLCPWNVVWCRVGPGIYIFKMLAGHQEKFGNYWSKVYHDRGSPWFKIMLRFYSPWLITHRPEEPFLSHYAQEMAPLSSQLLQQRTWELFLSFPFQLPIQRLQALPPNTRVHPYYPSHSTHHPSLPFLPNPNIHSPVRLIF